MRIAHAQSMNCISIPLPEVWLISMRCGAPRRSARSIPGDVYVLSRRGEAASEDPSGERTNEVGTSAIFMADITRARARARGLVTSPQRGETPRDCSADLSCAIVSEHFHRTTTSRPLAVSRRERADFPERISWREAPSSGRESSCPSNFPPAVFHSTSECATRLYFQERARGVSSLVLLPKNVRSIAEVGNYAYESR